MIAMILAGGSGTRLWPYSRTMSPKQFLSLGATHESLFQETCSRLEGAVAPEDIWVIGSESHQHELRQQMKQVLPDVHPHQVLLEPQARNTAPAILWGILQVPEARRHEPVLVLPADHLIQHPKRFLEAVRSATALTEQNWLVCFGIRPDRPETGYGYIQAGEPLEVGFRIRKFLEKPDLPTAERLVASPENTWNAGIFLASAQTFLDEFRKCAPDMLATFEDAALTPEQLADPEQVGPVFGRIRSESIDYAVLEKSDRIAVLPVDDIGWSDLGSWESLYEVSEKNESGNVLKGNVICHETRNSLIISTKKLVTSIGVENLLIVETDDALLVCDLRRSQDVKRLVETLKEEDRHEYQFHTRVLRPWGSATTVLEGDSFQIRLLEIDPGSSLSYQRHRHRSEHWVVLQGTADVHREGETLLLSENQSAYIPQGVRHQLSNRGRLPLEVIEVQLGAYLGEDDIERFEQPT